MQNFTAANIFNILQYNTQMVLRLLVLMIYCLYELKICIAAWEAGTEMESHSPGVSRQRLIIVKVGLGM